MSERPETHSEYILREILEIGRALGQERDVNVLLDLILKKCRDLTMADAGSLYIVEPATVEHPQRLRFKISQNDSCTFSMQEFTMPISTTSIAGSAVATGKLVNIADVYKLASSDALRFDSSFDQRVGYFTRSTVAIPMYGSDGSAIGVIQLINRKRSPQARLRSREDSERDVVPFSKADEDVLVTLVGQAAVSLENALLYDEIRSIFEGFVDASVHAIEQRDPTTSGHSRRVKTLSLALAQSTHDCSRGILDEVRFTPKDLKELEYAAILHDVGKIGVRERVLVKAKKLYPEQLDLIKLRFEFAQRSVESEILNRKLQRVEDGKGFDGFDALDNELAQRVGQLRRAWKAVENAVEPSEKGLDDKTLQELVNAEKLAFIDILGQPSPLLRKDEFDALKISRGSLADQELAEVRSHVVHTIDFLSKIPWSRAFARVPQIAGAHHELLDGSGYPRGLKAGDISMETQILTVADIYDALTARDRPYKKAYAQSHALEILEQEASRQRVNSELVKLFIDSKTYDRAG